MKRLLALLLGGLGLRALLRHSARPAGVPTHADELRAKLAETRVEDEPAPRPEPQDAGARRADVHAQARRAIDELKD